MQQANPLIRTKYRLPFIRPMLVSRPRLQEQVERGLHGPLTLVAAPAGYGKTTLVASCIDACGMPVAWLSLDKDDNRAGRFLAYLVATLQQVDERIGIEAAHLAAAQPAPPEAILTRLINDLDTAGKEIALVLDDYQFLKDQAAHEAVAFLLEHCPHTLHVLISTRSDPPLLLSRLRVRGQTVEIRAADLRFTESEAAHFLNDVMGLRLDARAVAALAERTEGWIAGLQMAALSMRDRKDVSGFVEGFSGTNRYILDYLLEEVLTSQPPRIQRFLLCTSILERLSAPLCDAVLDGYLTADEEAIDKGLEDSTLSEASTLRQSASILEYLERANLFLVPLDDERRWFRYHHLFADLLRAQLAHSPYAHYETVLHARAAGWYEVNGLPDEAIHHALAAADYLGAARQAEAAAEHVWLNGQYATILAWTEALPNHLVHDRPWLCVWNAWAYSQMGLPHAMVQWIAAAEESAESANEDAQALRNEIAALKVFVISFSRDYGRAIAFAEDVLKQPLLRQTDASAFIRCNLLHVLSSMYMATGQLRKAEQTCQETIDMAGQIGLTVRYIHAVNKLALVYMATGRLAGSARILEDAWSFLEKQGHSNDFAAVQLHFRKIDLLYEWNRFDEVQRLVDSVVEQRMTVGVPYLLVDLCNVQALAWMARGDYTKAEGALQQALALGRQTYIWEGLTWRTEWLQIKLWLRTGDVSLAPVWAFEQTEEPSLLPAFADEVRVMARAHALMAQGSTRDAIALLDRLSDTVHANGRTGSLLEVLVQKALALQSAGESSRAAVEIDRALALAEPEGYVRVFLDAGQAMRPLLAQWLAHAGLGPLRTYAITLLSHFDAEMQAMEVTQPKAPSAGGLVEPLSPRELEVLQLLALGMTNQDIARQLIVSPGTVKAHTAAIYRKLDVANRTEAVSRARHLGILL